MSGNRTVLTLASMTALVPYVLDAHSGRCLRDEGRGMPHIGTPLFLSVEADTEGAQACTLGCAGLSSISCVSRAEASRKE